MAIENKYVNTQVAAGGVAKALEVNGKKVLVLNQTFEVAAADDNGSIYRVFPNINPELIPLKIEIANDAITAGTDYDLGLYQSKSLTDGAVIDKDALADGADLSSAHIIGAELSGLSAVDVANKGKSLLELAALADDTLVIGNIKAGFDICLTANVVGTAAGTITVTGYFVDSL